MQAQELMLNNLFSLTSDGLSVVVADRAILSSILRDKFAGGMYPIPLTTEWLEKLGWDGESNSDFWEKGDVTIGYYYGESNGFYFQYTDHVRIEFVHQLQNLYYILTGKPLTLPT